MTGLTAAAIRIRDQQAAQRPILKEISLFSLIVSSRPWGPHNGEMQADRVLNSTSDDLKQLFMPGGTLATAAIREIPALFVQETENRPERPQFAHVGEIHRIELSGGQYRLEYHFDSGIPPISQKALKGLAGDLGIGRLELTTTHWAVKRADLFRSLFRQREATRLTPGGFAWPNAPVDPELVGVMMPFKGEFNLVRNALRRAAAKASMRMERVDNIWKSNVIIQDVIELIATSYVVICDLSGKNPNVLYEAGLAHMLGKEVILITQDLNDVPFDLKHYRIVEYQDTPSGRKHLVNGVSERLLALTTGS